MKTPKPQLLLFREHVRPTKRARFVCEEMLPDSLHCVECHAAAQAPLIATTRSGYLGCCCKSMAVLSREGLLLGKSRKPNPLKSSHRKLIKAFA